MREIVQNPCRRLFPDNVRMVTRRPEKVFLRIQQYNLTESSFLAMGLLLNPPSPSSASTPISFSTLVINPILIRSRSSNLIIPTRTPSWLLLVYLSSLIYLNFLNPKVSSTSTLLSYHFIVDHHRSKVPFSQEIVNLGTLL